MVLAWKPYGSRLGRTKYKRFYLGLARKCYGSFARQDFGNNHITSRELRLRRVSLLHSSSSPQ